MKTIKIRNRIEETRKTNKNQKSENVDKNRHARHRIDEKFQCGNDIFEVICVRKWAGQTKKFRKCYQELGCRIISDRRIHTE